MSTSRNGRTWELGGSRFGLSLVAELAFTFIIKVGDNWSHEFRRGVLILSDSACY
jgi:hypothetical protein